MRIMPVEIVVEKEALAELVQIQLALHMQRFTFGHSASTIAYWQARLRTEDRNLYNSAKAPSYTVDLS